MTWREIIAKSAGYLAAKNVPDAETAAELLAARCLKCGRGLLAGHLEGTVPERFVDALRRAVVRLAKGEPIQYVLGEWDFRYLTLKCDRRALIPRPETEELVTLVLKYLASRASATSNLLSFTSNLFIIDVGTGTGAIILSLAKEFKGEAIFLGTDISEDAIALAKENAAKCGLESRVRFAVMDGLDDFDEPGVVDVLVSNPPYIESAVVDTLDPRVKDFEPRLALDGGASGLDFYDRYLADALNILKPGGAVFFEIGETQGPALEKLFRDYGFSDIVISRDLSGRPRFASAVLSS